MKYIYILLLFLTIPAFSQNANVNSWDTGSIPETFSWDAATINNKLNLTISKREFEAIYKKADSIASPLANETCGTEEELAAKFLYYKGVKFEVDNGVLNLRKIDFTKKKGMYMNYKGAKFNEHYTLESYKKQFPQSGHELQNVEGGLQMATLLTDDLADKFEWRFYFTKGKLQAIECYFPCD